MRRGRPPQRHERMVQANAPRVRTMRADRTICARGSGKTDRSLHRGVVVPGALSGSYGAGRHGDCTESPCNDLDRPEIHQSALTARGHGSRTWVAGTRDPASTRDPCPGLISLSGESEWERQEDQVPGPRPGPYIERCARRGYGAHEPCRTYLPLSSFPSFPPRGSASHGTCPTRAGRADIQGADVQSVRGSQSHTFRGKNGPPDLFPRNLRGRASSTANESPLRSGRETARRTRLSGGRPAHARVHHIHGCGMGKP
jgi:hypothetical protein